MKWKSDVIYTWALQAACFANLQNVPIAMEFHDFPMGFMGPKLFKMLLYLKTKKLIITTTLALAKGIEERFNLNMRQSLKQLDNPLRLRMIDREIARIKTILVEDQKGIRNLAKEKTTILKDSDKKAKGE